MQRRRGDERVDTREISRFVQGVVLWPMGGFVSNLPRGVPGMRRGDFTDESG